MASSSSFTSRAVPIGPVIVAALDGGLGYDDLLRDPDAVLQVQVGPWNELLDGDVIRLWWGNDEVAQYSVSNGGGAVIITLPVRAADIRKAGEGTILVHYVITTGIGNQEIPSSPTSVLVKFSLPGGLDTRPDSPYINDALAAPTVTPNPVPDGATSATVTISPWENMTVGDELTLSWAGQLLKSPALAAGDVGREVTLTVPKDVLVAAGGGIALPVTYSIRDVVNNWSLFAPYAFPDVQIEDPNALESPQLQEAVDGMLDVTELSAGSVLTVFVPRYAGIASGDRVVVDWAGLTAAGAEVDWHSAEYSVPSPLPFVITFTVPASVAKPLAQGSLNITYRVINKGQSSARLRLQVTGEVDALPAPSVSQAVGGVLDPAAAPTGATVVVQPYAGMAVGDMITCSWTGLTAKGEPTQWDASRTVSGSILGKAVSFTVPAAEVVKLDMGSVVVAYQVATISRRSRDGSMVPLATMYSLSLPLQVKGATSQPDLPPPSVDGEKDGFLPPDLAGTMVRVPQYTGMARGDRIDMTWAGRTPFTDWVLVNVPAEQNFTIDETVIVGNRDADVKVSYAVSANGVAKGVSAVLPFKVGTDEQWEPVAPRVKEAVDGTIDVSLPSITAVVPIYDGMGAGDEITLMYYEDDFAPLPAAKKVLTASAVGKPVSFNVPSFLYDLANKFFLFYEVVLLSGRRGTSRILELAVVKAEDDKPEAPFVSGAENGEISVFWGQINIIAPVYTGMAIGDVVTLWFKGVEPTISDKRVAELKVTSLTQLVFGMQKIDYSTHSRFLFYYTVSRASKDVTSENSITYHLPGGGGGVTPPALSFGGPQNMNCSGYHVAQGVAPRNPPANATYTRVATGGTPPYQYSVDNPLVAKITQAGVVTVTGNGTTNVSVRDSAGKTASHSLSVSGAAVFINFIDTSDQDLDGNCRTGYNGMLAIASRHGYNLVGIADVKSLWSQYEKEGQVATILGWKINDAASAWYWTQDKIAVNEAWQYNFNGNSLHDNGGRFPIKGNLAFCVYKLR